MSNEITEGVAEPSTETTAEQSNNMSMADFVSRRLGQQNEETQEEAPIVEATDEVNEEAEVESTEAEINEEVVAEQTEEPQGSEDVSFTVRSR